MMRPLEGTPRATLEVAPSGGHNYTATALLHGGRPAARKGILQLN